MTNHSHPPGQINYLPTHLLPGAVKTDQLIPRQPDQTMGQNGHHLIAQVIHLRNEITMRPEAMTDQVIPPHKGITILQKASTDQVIRLHKGVMIHPEAATGQVILHLPEGVHHPEVAVVADLQEVAVVPAIILLPREEEGNNMSNDISLIKRLQHGHHHAAALKNIDL
jgi:hypothetical protein